MKRFLPLLCLLWLLACGADAQAPDSLAPFTLSGAVDVYYGYDFSKPAGRDRRYTTQAYRHNEFNLNWAYLQADYRAERVRATLALQTGTYVQANYAAEPNALTRLIAQANAGVRLREGVWLDMGVLPSHIGYESTFSADNELYTRALMAENSPYYETGARLTAALSAQLTLQLLVLNGWQTIVETNSAKSLGLGISYTPTGQLTLSYNNYYGNEAPDGTAPKRRHFHNAYASYAFSDRLSVAGSMDYGRQEMLLSTTKASWYAGMVLAQYRVTPALSVAGRVEHYNDRRQLVVSTGTPNGFQTTSATVGVDYVPAPNFLLRLEARGYDSADRVFEGGGKSHDKNLLLVTSLSIKL
jgi:hypothetical protein